VVIRPLLPDDAVAYHAQRVPALQEHPEAFGRTPDEVAGVYRERPVKHRHVAYVWGVYVIPEQRGKGIARALVSDEELMVLDLTRGSRQRVP
jgi:GNAT superfamily N-acetyltransferase